MTDPDDTQGYYRHRSVVLVLCLCPKAKGGDIT